MKKFIVLLIAGLTCTGMHAQLTPLNLGCTDDSYVSSASVSATAGSATSMNIKVNSSSNYTRAFLKFDLSSIPFGAIIYSARLILTPNGVEGGDVSSSSFVLERVTETWDEGGISFSHAANYTTTTVNSVSTSSSLSGKRIFDVRNLVTGIVAQMAPNFGFRIRRNNETTATLGSSYYTKETSTAADRPLLEVKYYFPFQVASAVITHATGLTSTDGSIVPEIIHGTASTASYQWYKSDGTALATTQNLYNVGYGWYGLRISALGHTVYHAFLVGVENQDVNIRFKVNPEYSEEAFIYNRNYGGTDNSNSNYDNYAYYLSSNWGSTGDWYDARFLVRYNLWLDPALSVNQSDLHLSGFSHYNALRPNTSQMRKVTDSWRESQVTFNNAPATTGSIMKTLPSTSSATQNSIVDLNDFWNDWKTSNATNYGIDFRLDLYNFVRSRQQYHSSNAADTSLRPYIQFNVRLGYAENLATMGYYELKDEFDGGIAKTHTGKLKISFSEEYKIDRNKYLPLKIYDASHSLKGVVDLDGNITGTGTPVLEYHFNDNRHIIDLTALGLVDDKIYILEVKTSTGEKKYLKFLYKN